MDDLNEQEVFDEIRNKLNVILISDALDDLGFHEQVMRSDMRPIYQEAVVLGRAYTAITVEIYEVEDESTPGQPETVDSLKPNDVLVVGGHRPTHACIWGDLASVAAQTRGATGAVIDGNTRDVLAITELKFPVFSSGTGIATPLGRAKYSAHGCLVRCGGVLVNPGDIVFGDYSGVVVIPRELVKEVIKMALTRKAGEERLRKKLLQGVSMVTAQPKDSEDRWL